MSKSSSIDLAKQVAGEAAAQLIQPGMLVGLGTGTTAAYFIDALGKRCADGLKIQALATSEHSMHQARQVGIPLADPLAVSSLDITVDGADEIDSRNQMIKGGGGALLREKLLAYSSREMIVIVDQKKLVLQLGAFPVPVEVASFVYQTTLNRLKEQGYNGKLRLTADQKPAVTDNGNFIIDIKYTSPIIDAALEHERLKAILGVLETGLFFNIAKQVIIGYEKGRVKVRT
jgi:ribose 5-phosphate isomerase A